MALEGFILTCIFVYFLTIWTENTLYNLDCHVQKMEESFKIKMTLVE